jgi:hypothetical protein
VLGYFLEMGRVPQKQSSAEIEVTFQPVVWLTLSQLHGRHN